MKINFQTLGCKLNQAETETLKKDFAKSGFEIVDDFKGADLIMFNTCAVTEKAVRKTRQAIHKVKNQNPSAKVFATGCSFEQKNEVDLFITEKKNVVSDILAYLGRKVDNSELKYQEVPMSKDNKIRAMIKIQDGCDNFCSYCIISRRRGKVTSVSPDMIVKQIIDAESRNFREVVLTGVNINKYKFDGLDLAALLRLILENTSVERIRLGSIDPHLITPELIHIYKDSPRLCNHWHLSLQSGSDRILKSMNRQYSRKDFLEIVDKLRANDSDFGLTTDIIVGFPGETIKDLKESLSIVEESQFLKVHVFPYSKRPGTPASQMSDQIGYKEKILRCSELKKVAERVSREFKLKMLGKEFKVLFEDKREGKFEGYSDNFSRVFLSGNKNLQNKLISLKLKPENLKISL